MKKVTVYWDEVQSYCADLEIPSTLSPEEEYDYVKKNMFLCYENEVHSLEGDLISDSISIVGLLH